MANNGAMGELIVEGTTDSRYAAVADAFRSMAPEVGRGGAAFCASVRGEVVVDLWAGQAGPDRPWTQDTAAALFSATKGMVAACIALLHDRGRLDVDEPVATYWPEFAAAGKERLTVRQVLSHTCGLTEVPDYLDVMSLDGGGHGDYEEIRRRLAASAPQWEPGTAVGYHVMTYGYLAGAIVERVDGRSLARFFAEELAGPLGLDLQIGASDALLARKSMTLEADPLPDDDLGAAFGVLLAAARDESTLIGRACIARDGVGILDRLADLGNNAAMLRAATEGGVGSGDGIGTARGLAAFYGHLVDPEPNDATPSAATLESLNRIQLMAPDAILGIPNAFGVGFGRMLSATTVGPSVDSFGHGGAGGQVGFGDPEHQVGIGFTRSHLSFTSPLAAGLVAALYEAMAAAA
jgi:CubicO group peptidase (beta-lactamase class C family)